jgi:hypothetical protein
MADGESIPEGLQEVLDRLEAAAEEHEQVTIETMLEGVGRRSFGPLILIPGLLLLSPLSGVPGMPTTIGIMALLIAGQLLIGRNYFWLPGWILRRKMTHEKFERMVRLLRPAARFIDRWTHRRLSFLTSQAAVYVTAACSVAIALTMPTMEIVPFTSLSAAAALTLFGLALIARDGLLMLLAYAFIGLSVWLIVSRLL